MPQSTQVFSRNICLIFNLLFKKIEEEFDNDKRIYDDARSHYYTDPMAGLFYRSHMLSRSRPDIKPI